MSRAFILVMDSLGLGGAAELSSGAPLPNVVAGETIAGAHGAARERSRGKDTPSGHWEMAGVPVIADWGYFPRETPAFPATLTDALITCAGLPGLLGDCHA